MTTALGSPQVRLSRVAEEMRGAVESAEQHLHGRLPHGLETAMQRVEGRWRLALAREGTWPSEQEVEACRRDFCVPEGALERRTRQMRRHPKTGRQIDYAVVEVTWRER